MYKFFYDLYAARDQRLGMVGITPPPNWLRLIFDRYPMQQRIIAYAKLLKGKSLYQNVPRELGCASSVSRFLEMIDRSFFGSTYEIDNIVSTITLANAMIQSPRFVQLERPINGCVVISPTASQHRVGHCGIYINGRIWNNHRGIWDNNWTMSAWLRYYNTQINLNTLYFFPLEDNSNI